MRTALDFASALSSTQALSFAARERRAQRELLALCGVVLAALATVAVSLGQQDAGLAASSAPATPSVGQNTLESVDAFAREPGATRAPALMGALSPAPSSDDASNALATRARAPRTQAEFAARLRAISDPASLLAALDEALGVEQPAAQNFAALEVAYARLGEDAAPRFLRAARELTCSSAGAESVGRASVAWLAKRAQHESTARYVLEELAQCYDVASTLRAAAGVALVQSAPASELSRIEGRLLRDRDAHVGLCIESALRARRESLNRGLVALEQDVQE